MNQEKSGPPRPSARPVPAGMRRATYLLVAPIAYALLPGCATFGHRMDDWVGQRYSDFLRWTGHEKEQKSVVADAKGNSEAR